MFFESRVIPLARKMTEPIFLGSVNIEQTPKIYASKTTLILDKLAISWYTNFFVENKEKK